MRKIVSIIAIGLTMVSGDAFASIEVAQLTKTSSFVTAGGEGSTFKRTPQKALAIGDMVILITTVTWQPIDKSAGSHKVVWRWYSKGSLISEIKQRHTFKPTPYELWARMPASALGAGNHKVEILIDEKPFDTQEFSVSE
jgi:hypothetical protein